MDINTSVDFRTDAFGKDPDKYSLTLRRYHKLLWSKTLPSGQSFELVTNIAGDYLHHSSSLGVYSLSSDSIIATFTKWKRFKHIVDAFSEVENEAFRAIGYTIGGMMVFPSNTVDGKQTINGARGFHNKIADRFDLTLDCIRLHYLNQDSPLSGVMGRYAEYFRLFVNFRGFVEFFSLQDLVNNDCSEVRFFTERNSYEDSPLPSDISSYRLYRDRSIEFVEARNRRIDRLVNRVQAGA